jgi:AAA domain/Bifunctional DNA primase/polymerase, N-terminal/Primase C terminal 2 (PriCT-2)
MTQFFDFAERHGLALFPMPSGRKEPFGIVPSFAHDFSRDPQQWAAWRTAHKCNFGIVAAPSRLVIVDVDVAEIGPTAAWSYWAEWCQSRGLPVYQPYCRSARGGWHVAFRVPSDVDMTTLRQVPLIGPLEGVSKKAIVDLRVGNGFVVAPESIYDGAPKGETGGTYALLPEAVVHPAPAELLAACARVSRKEGVARAGEACAEDTQKVLEWMAERDGFASYQQWIEAGMILRAEFGDDPGFQLWQLTNDGTCSADAEAAKWDSFSLEKGNGVGIDTLRKRAQDAACPHTIRTSIKWMFRDLLDGKAFLPLPAAPLPAGSPLPDGWHWTADGKTALDREVPPKKLIQSSAEFVAGFVAPSYLLDGILQKHFVYAMTAATGVGKTAIALLLGAQVALGRKFGDRDVERGRVLYFASENSVDVQARWLAMAEHMGFDVDTIDAHFISGATKLSEITERVIAEANALGDLALVIVDTSAATFEGADENSNVDGLQHAKRMRSLTGLKGGPTVLVLCHPVKSATSDNLAPRGGGSFVAEIDGNLCARKGDSSVEVHWAVKFRGMDFAPMAFRLDTVTAARLKDAKGRNIPTVIATPIDEAAKQVLAASERSDQDRVLRAIYDRAGESSNKIAEHLGWKMRDGKPYGVRVRRACERMAGDGLVLKHRGAWVLSARGEKELNGLDRLKPGTSAVPPLPPFPLPRLPN